MNFLRKKDEYDYFAGFSASAQAGSSAARYLLQTLQSYNSVNLLGHVEAMHKIENDADSQKHEMTKHLAHEFMTPIEREDIAALSQALDNVVDAVEDVMQRLYMFNVSVLRVEALGFASLIVKSCEAVEKLMQEFRHFKKSKQIHSFIIAVNTLESEGDKLHASAMRRLFTTSQDTGVQMVWMSLFEALEECMDACEDVANIVESVTMKNT